MQYQQGDRLWIPDEEHAWLCGTVIFVSPSSIDLNTEFGLRKINIANLKGQMGVAKLEPCGNHLGESVDNLVDLDELSEGAILHHVRNRFSRKVIYTHVGSILVAVNPFEKLNIYGTNEMKRAQACCSGNLPTLYPHVFVSASLAYQQLCSNRKNQSVLISGESGAGKTETTKKVLAFLASVAPAAGQLGEEAGIETKILQSNPLLEALGNAKTLRNDNSSRFGKWMQVGFDERCAIQNCEVVNYLLEKSRVVGQSPRERNYHVFYQLLGGAPPDLRQELHLQGPEQYRYLNQSGCTAIDGVDDAADFRSVWASMNTLQFSEETVRAIWRLLAGLLQLGNIGFQEGELQDSSAVTPASEQALLHCGELLGLGREAFRFCLTEKRTQMARGSILNKPLSVSQAADNRDTLAKAIYSGLFDWTVRTVNILLKTKDAPLSVGILDIFGFEVFDVNSFEQLCINYANEKLQFHFNEVIFSQERDMYEQEGIALSQVVFEDNGPCVELIEGRTGLISLLEDECSVGANGSDLLFIAKVQKEFGEGRPARNDHFKKNKVRPECFSVSHFAGDVEYSVTGFVEKNRDSLSSTSREVLELSSLPLLAELFAPSAEAVAASEFSRGRGKGSGQPAKATLGSQFRSQLVGLVRNLRLTEPHFIRCVKPNQQKKGGLFDGPLALRQLRYAGLFEAIRIRKSGFAYRASLRAFASAFQVLLDGLPARLDAHRKQFVNNEASGQPQERAFCCQLLEMVTALGALAREDWHVGSSKVFLKTNGHRLGLDRLRAVRVTVYAERLQRAGRRFLCMLQARELRKELQAARLRREELRRLQDRCAVVLQKHARRFLVRKMMEAMRYLLQLRQVLQSRQTQLVSDLLATIEKQGLLSSPHGAIAQLFSKEVKVAKVMLRLLKLQEALLEDLGTALQQEDAGQLHRLLLRSERLDMQTHPLVLKARQELQVLRRRRVVVKQLLQFLACEDQHCETVLQSLREARQLGVDLAFVDKVQRVYDLAGPRLKARNRLRSAIEVLDRFAIERACLEVLAIQSKYSGGSGGQQSFADTELKAARFVLRLLHFESQFSPTEAAEGSDGGVSRQLFAASSSSSSSGPEETSENSLWGCPLLPCSTGAKLTPEVTALCDAIVQQAALSEEDPQAAGSLRALKQQLQAAAGSVRGIYATIRHFKWVKTACVWRYPEVEAADSEEGDLPGSRQDNKEGSFYGLRPAQARSAAFVICSLHSEFGVGQHQGPSTAPSGLLQAALGCVDLSSSMAQTLRSLQQAPSVDKPIVLPNGRPFVKTRSNAIGDRACRDNIGSTQVARKAPLPVTPTKKQSAEEESGLEAQLLMSRKLRDGMLQRLDRNREALSRQHKSGWK
mmetsp:Transcript_27478/g.37764  ORF Transcript_27478/g.37764 Transcript_27478/m.37764 type:complete len:1363 (-) Transcript_27478:153-4241(-)